MRYRVTLTASAEADLLLGDRYVASRSGARAGKRWARDVRAVIRGLSHHPRRYSLDPEAQAALPEARFAPIHSHRIVFEVDDPHCIVAVIRVWHMAREGFSP